MIDDQQLELLIAHVRGSAIDKRIREKQHEQQEQQNPKRQQKQVAQATILDRTLYAPLEKHQGAEREWSRRVSPQQVDIDRNSHRRDTRQKPGSQESHLIPPLSNREVFPEGIVKRPVG